MGVPDGYYTYEIIVSTEAGEPLWAGTMDAKRITGPNGNPALEFSPGGLTKELAEVMKANPLCRVEWSEAWDVVDGEE